MRVTRAGQAVSAAFLLHFILFLSSMAGTPGTVYFVLGSDTALWNAANGINIAVHTNHFSTALYTDPAGRAHQAMDPAWRAQFTDSFGNPLKLTWWMLVGSVYGSSDNTDAPVPNLLPLHLMRKHHGEAARRLGDEITLHYHTFLWSDYAGAGTYFWNQARTFRECRGDFDRALAQSLVEEDTYTVTFRSGWHYMDNEWQGYINQLWPYNMDNDSPHVGNPPRQPYFNILDWSKAPTNFIPYHPASTNYQVPGDGAGWNVRSVKTPNVTQSLVDTIFAEAEAGTSQVVSFWAHLPESFFLTEMARMDQLIHTSARDHPGVVFRYCTSVEAMQRWRGVANPFPPALEITVDESGPGVVLMLKTDRPLFQREPFIALKDTSENYRIVGCEPAGIDAWIARMPLPKGSLAKAAIAVVDPDGNLTTRTLRWIPDDLYVDNGDPEYRETSGAWTTDLGPAWERDSRGVRLAPGETASAEWILPITERRRYTLFVQVPAHTNTLASVDWTIRSDGTDLAVVPFEAGTPTPGWVRLAAVDLDPSVTNRVILSARNPSSEIREAAADVIRVTPLAQSAGAIGSVSVDAGSGTANLLWTTSVPCRSWVDYGIGLRHGSTAAADGDGPETSRHVATLTHVIPGQRVQYLICAEIGLEVVTLAGEFTVPPPAAPVRVSLAAFTNQWQFTANNLDGTPWTAVGFDDSGWRSGRGLLWADTRARGGGALIGPKGQELPVNGRTGFPWTTYYARTRFVHRSGGEVQALGFTNYIDDGAIFYLNGNEIWRNNLPAVPATVSNGTLATGFNCHGDADCAVTLQLTGAPLALLVPGTNVLAVEVHNYDPRSPDITLGSEITALILPEEVPVLKVVQDVTGPAILYWNGTRPILQKAVRLNSEAEWMELPGGMHSSPYVIPPESQGFFRLRNPE